MRFGVNVIVGLGIAAAVLLGLGLGFDIGALVILALIVGCGALAIAVSRKAVAGESGPRTCPHCGGLISPNAPFCKHCNTVL